MSGAAALLASTVCATEILLGSKFALLLLAPQPSFSDIAEMPAATLLSEVFYDHLNCDEWPFILDLLW